MKDIANEKIVDTSAVEKGDPLGILHWLQPLLPSFLSLSLSSHVFLSSLVTEQLRLKILEESINDVYKQTGKTPGYEEFLYRKEVSEQSAKNLFLNHSKRLS